MSTTTGSPSVPPRLPQWEFVDQLLPLLDEKAQTTLKQYQHSGSISQLVESITTASSGALKALNLLVDWIGPDSIRHYHWSFVKAALDFGDTQLFSKVGSLFMKTVGTIDESGFLAEVLENIIRRNSVQDLQLLATLKGSSQICSCMVEGSSDSLFKQLLESEQEMLDAVEALIADVQQNGGATKLKLSADVCITAAASGRLDFLFRLFSKEAVKAAIGTAEQYDRLIKLIDSSAGPGAEIRLLLDLVPAKELDKILKNQATPGFILKTKLMRCLRGKDNPAVIGLIDTMSDATLRELLLAKETTRNLIGRAIEHDNVEVLEVLLKRLGPDFLVNPKMQRPVTQSYLSQIAQHDASNCLAFVKAKLTKEQLIQGLSYIKSDRAPLHYAFSEATSSRKLWIALYLELGASLIRATVDALPDRNLFNDAWNWRRWGWRRESTVDLDILKGCFQLYQAAGKDPTDAIVQQQADGMSVFRSAALFDQPEALKLLMEKCDEKKLALALLPARGSTSPLIRLWLHNRKGANDSILPQLLLLSRQLDDRTLTAALDLYCLETKCPELLAELKARFPTADGYEKALIRIAGKTLLRLAQQGSRYVTYNQVRPEYLNGLDPVSTQLLNGNAFPAFKARHPALAAELKEHKLALLTQIFNEKSETREIALNKRLSDLEGYMNTLAIALVMRGCSKDFVERWRPLLLQTVSHRDKGVRRKLYKLLVHHPLGGGQGSAITSEMLAQSTENRQPSLFLIALSALEQRGVSKETLTALHAKVVKWGRDMHEEQPLGRSCLRMLVNLAYTDCLSDADVDRVIRAICDNDLPKVSGELNLIIGLGKIQKLQSAELGDTKPDFSKMAQRLFKELIPLTGITNVSEKYETFFGSQRKSDALLTYIAQVHQDQDVREDLINFIQSVFSGTFKEQRYSEANNPHLAALYAAREDFNELLPKLVNELGSYSIATLTGTPRALPIDANAVRGIAKSGLLSQKAFPHFHAFIANGGVMGAEGRKKFVAASRAAKHSPSAKQSLGLEGSLMKLYQKSRIIQEANGDPAKITGLRHDLDAEFKKALSLAKELKLDDLRSHLDALWTSYQKEQGSDVADYTVSLTDDYLDLFLIGTEVDDSCQSVYSVGDENKALLSYAMNGKTLPIVVRKPGGKATVARRLLRIEFDKGSGKPALFLDELYANYKDKAINTAIEQMAHRVAKRLKLPLYVEVGVLEMSDVTLISRQGPVSWGYANPALDPMVRQEIYEHGAKRLPNPVSTAPRSSDAGSSNDPVVTN